MKALITFFTALFFYSTALGDCADNILSAFPSGNTIKQNSIFVLNEYAWNAKIIKGLNQQYPIYLKCGDEKIKLIVKEIHVGQFNESQAIVFPEKQLVDGHEYTMCIDNLPEGEALKRFNEQTQVYEPIVYKVSHGKDILKPIIASSPELIDKTYKRFGCGPSAFAVFKYSVIDSSEIIVKVKLKNVKNGDEKIYYVEASEGNICVGYSMCSGAFHFDDGIYYNVTFSFMDASGNIIDWDDDIGFFKPMDATELVFEIGTWVLLTGFSFGLIFIGYKIFRRVAKKKSKV